MRFLFLHQNFPGQFTHLAPALAAEGHQVVALTTRVQAAQDWRGVRVIPYRFDAPEGQKLHPWLNTMNAATHRGTAVLRACEELKRRGFVPDVCIAHSGWGEALFLRDVYPSARIGIFCEFFYMAEGGDIDFDPEFAHPGEFGRAQRVRLKNMAMRSQLEDADAGISPTRWQADAYPEGLREKIEVIHDGIDTESIAPDHGAALEIDGIGRFTRRDELLTFVNRNLEPYRGFHVFMRVLPDLLRRRPRLKVLMVGEDGVSYGTPPRGGGSWKQVMMDEIADRMTPEMWGRVHFVGRLPRQQFTQALQVSRVHLYMTYPFVLSWSLIEAMSAGCAIAASDTAPVAEVIGDGEEGLLFDFFDGAGLIGAVERLLDDPVLREKLGRQARARAVANYDLTRVCLPAQRRWIERLIRGDDAAGDPAV